MNISLWLREWEWWGGKIEDIPLSSALYPRLVWGLGRAPNYSITLFMWFYWIYSVASDPGI